MTPDNWITLASIIVPAATGFITTYWLVKTMRAIANPSQDVEEDKRKVGSKKLYPAVIYVCGGSMVLSAAGAVSVLYEPSWTKFSSVRFSLDVGFIFYMALFIHFCICVPIYRRQSSNKLT